MLLVDISRCHPRQEEVDVAQEYAEKALVDGSITHYAWPTWNKEWHEDELIYKPAEEYPELLRWGINLILAEEKAEGRTPLVIHVTPDYEMLWNVYVYGRDGNDEPYNKRLEVSKRDHRAKGVASTMLVEV